jgi:hypothetical protein
METKDVALMEETLSSATDLALLADMLPAVSAPDIQPEASAYLPYLTIVQGQSHITGPPHCEPAGSFILHFSKDSHENLGKSMDVYICDQRYKAMLFDDKGVTSYLDSNSPEYLEAKRNAEDKVKGYAWGYEYLLYLGSSGRFCTFFCNNISMRMAAGKHLAPRLRQLTTVMAEYVSFKGNNWWSFKAEPCQVDLAVPVSIKDVIAQIERFQRASAVEEEADMGALVD